MSGIPEATSHIGGVCPPTFRRRMADRLRRELFIPGALGLLINPFHIARRALYRALRGPCAELDGNILDFGCGSKPYRPLFSAAASYTGVDFESSGHDHRRSEVDHFYDGRTLPFADAMFDSVVSFETLEHVFNPNEMLAEIGRVTRPGGHLLITVPFVWDEHEAPYDFGRYTGFGLRHIVEKAGYEVLWVHKSTSYVLAVAQLFIAYLSQHVLPRRGVLRHAAQVVVVFPCTVAAYVADALLPRSDRLFLDCILLARKTSAPP